MFAFLCFLTFSLIGESEGQNCTFPCNWHNKDFKVSYVDSSETFFWNFSDTTFIIDDDGTTRYECTKIVGRFLIVRRQDTDHLTCYVIEINNADSFTTTPTFLHKESDWTNECNACSKPEEVLLKMSAVGTVAQNQTRPECNIPVGCTPGNTASEPITCEDNGNIEGDCNQTTTHPTTPPTPTTSSTTPPPKHCKHGHP